MSQQDQPTPSRRTVLKAAGVGLAGAAAGGVVVASAPSASAATIVHPGLLHTSGDISRMATKVGAGEQPWSNGWARLTANAHAANTWKAKPLATVYRGTGTPENYGQLYNDIHAAYQNALRYRVTGITAYGTCARDILNAWSATLTKVDGSSDKFLAAGLYGYQFANAAELIRTFGGFDLARFQTMLRTVFYPMNDDFLRNHNGNVPGHYWANWDLCTIASVLAIGVVCDDQAKINQAVDYFTNGAGMGSINHAIPYVYDDQGLAQFQESGRDQGHATLGIGLLGTICEMAWNQGIDLYALGNNRIMKCAEYVAKYNLGGTVPYTTYTRVYGPSGGTTSEEVQTVISATGRGELRPIWESIYNHYARRRGLSVPNVAAFAAKVRPEGGGGDYGPNSGGFDQLGFGTLVATR